MALLSVPQSCDQVLYSTTLLSSLISLVEVDFHTMGLGTKVIEILKKSGP